MVLIFCGIKILIDMVGFMIEFGSGKFFCIFLVCFGFILGLFVFVMDILVRCVLLKYELWL